MIISDAEQGAVTLVEHEAMATVFAARIRGVEERYARQAARACFDRIDRLEQSLSRYIEGSDVHRINRMKAGETIRISEDAHACLRLAQQAYERTGGLFDVTLGRWTDSENPEPVPPDPPGRFVLHPDRQTVTCESEGRAVDLGGIGKGYALECLRPLMAEWEIAEALWSAGGSTVMATGRWTVHLRGDAFERDVELRDDAVSASGTSVKGAHIAAPPGADRPYRWKRVWVQAENAALSDAFATAAFLMDEDELRAFRSVASSIQRIWTES